MAKFGFELDDGTLQGCHKHDTYSVSQSCTNYNNSQTVVKHMFKLKKKKKVKLTEQGKNKTIY